MEAEQLKAAEEAKRNSPEAVATREASRTEYEGLDTEAAAKLAGEAFPAVVDELAGGPPRLPAGESITAYLASNVAQLGLPGGEPGVIESVQPMAVESSSGQFAPVDLGLSEVGGGGAFEPRTPLVAVRIPKDVGEGVSLGSTGVSLMPVDAQGAQLGGEGSVDGASVLYANTQTDSDTLVKPTTLGFETSTMLRSVESPEQIFFKVGMPQGASLVQASDGSGAIEVVKEGLTLASIPAVGARDAEGMVVPSSMSFSGDVVSVSVEHGGGSYLYPIEVDPEITDKELVEKNPNGGGGPWEYKAMPSTGAFEKYGGAGTLGIKAAGEYKATNWAAWAYETHGVSKIYEMKGVASGENTGGKSETSLLLAYTEAGKEHVEKRELLSNESLHPKYEKLAGQVCSEAGCPTTAGKEKKHCAVRGGSERDRQQIQRRTDRRYSLHLRAGWTARDGMVQQNLSRIQRSRSRRKR